MKMIRASRIAIVTAVTCGLLSFGLHKFGATPVHAQSAPSIQGFVLDTETLTQRTSSLDGNGNGTLTAFYTLPTSFSSSNYVVTCTVDDRSNVGYPGIAPPNFTIGAKSANGFYMNFYNNPYEFYDCVAVAYGGLSGIVG